MFSKCKPRESANNPTEQKSPMNTNERILKECHELYADSRLGLVKIAKDLGLKVLAPHKKIHVMLIGNHSAGKSSFINWYIEEHVQKTGVAIETRGFSFITGGKKRETLLGKATLHLLPHLRPLGEIEGVMDFLQTEICTSKQKKFNLITFVDTPGLVDGDMNYPFDIEKTIQWLGDFVDLVFVFFDPIGQALCKRTLNIVEELYSRHPERIKFYLSKADEAGHETDRQRVMMQIVQELWQRSGLNTPGFNMPTIYIPNPNKEINCVNQIDDVCKDIERTISHTIQNTLNYLEEDCKNVKSAIDKVILEDNEKSSHNFYVYLKMTFAFILWLLITCGIFFPEREDVPLSFISSFKKREKTGSNNMELPSPTELFVTISAIFLVFIWMWNRNKCPVIDKKRKQEMVEQQDHIKNVVENKGKALYNEYFDEVLSSHDF